VVKKVCRHLGYIGQPKKSDGLRKSLNKKIKVALTEVIPESVLMVIAKLLNRGEHTFRVMDIENRRH
jgi:hypothetical protein